MRILVACLLLASCGGAQPPSTLSEVLPGSWTVTMGANWAAQWSGVAVQTGAISGTGTATLGSAASFDGPQVWNVALGGRIASDTHATIRMDLTPATDTALPSFTVFCEVDLASMSTMDGYVATASPPVSNAVLLVGAPLLAKK